MNNYSKLKWKKQRKVQNWTEKYSLIIALGNPILRVMVINWNEKLT
jgi:hypothetical protein